MGEGCYHDTFTAKTVVPFSYPESPERCMEECRIRGFPFCGREWEVKSRLGEEGAGECRADAGRPVLLRAEPGGADGSGDGGGLPESVPGGPALRRPQLPVRLPHQLGGKSSGRSSTSPNRFSG